MANSTNKARTFRFPQETNDKITELGQLLSKNDTEVLRRAVDYLYESRKEVAESDLRSRLSGLK